MPDEQTSDGARYIDRNSKGIDRLDAVAALDAVDGAADTVKLQLGIEVRQKHAVTDQRWQPPCATRMAERMSGSVH
jgi:hypothetical protein